MIRHPAYAKVNIFLKITGKRGDYHTITSRFMKVKTLCDTIWFEKKFTPEFEIRGNFDCEVHSNTIYKAYKHLQTATRSHNLSEFFEHHAVCVDKKIPSFAGLGGGSSDAATFLHMCNNELELDLSIDELAEIGSNVGADVPFFIYGYDSANVSGIGEIVERYNEPLIDFEIVTPDIKISTPAVYRYYREHLYAPITPEEAAKLESTPSRDLLASMNPKSANDLYPSALGCYNELEEKVGWFYSGSGSSFFKVK
ncbi:MAG: 4-(cytidine 5'-diphospho)-2-C-methyl-D-erythritol kinase [Sulfuricurvum sp.]|uniref:4-(cytidine 5'-diphospho)-2-C-methyl-D-erythritol kinase n=1 Tax=Sulfuricurvum sp. TaxID=2025608 RepID=UPI002623048B|nr:4-(cytidine 5'-diphospho)-2-C-methyl-D-erythritol kinase [Sulfuricurvum sp.]MDD2829193.1 4-(cytidine 5'-diphospho)-2-C-methyl-D-erythritol kinase [Sulfuricurvum sp.]MDD4949026.1 4-(cytidine 5'-diphospho)-2-C-methyl-D-erythritol kinase [Sulfuricurvum sp.]